MSRELEQVKRAVDVCFGVELRFGKRWSNACSGGEVNYAIEACLFEYLFECGAIANVCFDECVTGIVEVFANVGALDFGFVEVVEVVNDRDLLDIASDIAREQTIHQMRTDETRAAGDQDGGLAIHPQTAAPSGYCSARRSSFASESTVVPLRFQAPSVSKRRSPMRRPHGAMTRPMARKSVRSACS